MRGLIQKNNRHFIFVLLFLVIVVGTILRLTQVNYPLDNPDVGRDLLISKHIALFGEHTLLGPANPLLETFKNSPLYYYLLAIILKVADSEIAVGLVNLILQISIIPMVFIIGQKLSNWRVGIIAATIIATSPLVISQSIHFWQPYLMSWFLNLSILTLVLAWKDQSFKFLLTSTFLLATAGAVGNYTLPLVPAFLVIVLLFLKNWAKFSVVTSVLLITLLAYFVPNFIYASAQPTLGLNIAEKFAPTTFFSNLLANLTTFLSGFFSLEIVIPILVVVTIWTMTTDKPEKNKLWLITGALLSFFLISSFFQLPWRPDYSTPIFTPVALLLAISLEMLPYYRLKVALLGLLLIFPIGKFNLQLPFRDLPKIAAATRAIESETIYVKNKEKLPNLNFFRIVYYPGRLNGQIVLSYDAVFWYGIEKDWNQRLTYLVSSDFGYRSLGKNDYLVLACREISKDECFNQLAADQSSGQSNFIAGEGTFKEIESFYHQNEFTFYLMKRT